MSDLQEDIAKLISQSHPSSKFPVDDLFKSKTCEWWYRVCREVVKWEMNANLASVLEPTHKTTKESEFVFKTYELVDGKYYILFSL